MGFHPTMALASNMHSPRTRPHHLKSVAPNSIRSGHIHVESRIMRHIMVATSEAEIGALFHNVQEAAHIQTVLKEMGRERPAPTRITTDNSTAESFANRRIKIKRSKAMVMRFYWIQDRLDRRQFRIHWQQGENNHADCFTKHHPPSHHQRKRPIYSYLHTDDLLLVPNATVV
jgi:hypothetical protein